MKCKLYNLSYDQRSLYTVATYYNIDKKNFNNFKYRINIYYDERIIIH